MPSEGPSVLLIPGLLASAAVWSEMRTHLVREFQVISCDLPRQLAPGRPVAALQAQRFRELMDALGVPAAHVVAHGTGCQAAIFLALESPCRARSLTLVNPVIPQRDAAARLEPAGHLNMLTQWLQMSYGPCIRQPETQRLLEEILNQQTLARLPEPAPTWGNAAWGADAAMSGLAYLEIPILCVNGQNEPQEILDLTRTLFGKAPRFRCRQIAGASHHCPRETPAELSEIVAEFVHDVENPVSAR